MTRNTEPSLPPSEPRPSSPGPSSSPLSSPGSSKGPNSLPSVEALQHPARVQLVAALLLGLALVAIPLYLWRRPRSVETLATTSTDADGGVTTGAPAATDGTRPPAGTTANATPSGSPATAPTVVMTLLPPDAGSNLAITAPRIVACHDRGSKKTPAASCDHVAALEKALTDAVNDVGACLPSNETGTIEYLADVSFLHKRNALHVTAPRQGRTVKNAKDAAACATKVKARLATLALDGLPHSHDRYLVAVTATYP